MPLETPTATEFRRWRSFVPTAATEVLMFLLTTTPSIKWLYPRIWPVEGTDTSLSKKSGRSTTT